jgi:hypothetical protein
MIKGTLIAESVRTGATLDGVTLMVREIRRFAPGNLPDYQPKIWTTIEFEADDADADAEPLARRFAEILDEPGWYVNFSSATETFVVYRDRIFRYPRGDSTGRAQAQAHGRIHGVPEPQLDWSE